MFIIEQCWSPNEHVLYLHALSSQEVCVEVGVLTVVGGVNTGVVGVLTVVGGVYGVYGVGVLTVVGGVYAGGVNTGGVVVDNPAKSAAS